MQRGHLQPFATLGNSQTPRIRGLQRTFQHPAFHTKHAGIRKAAQRLVHRNLALCQLLHSDIHRIRCHQESQDSLPGLVRKQRIRRQCHGSNARLTRYRVERQPFRQLHVVHLPILVCLHCPIVRSAEPADGSVIQQAEACLLAARGIRVFNFSHAVIIVARSPQKGKDNRKDGNKSISVHRCSFFSYSVRRFLYVLP